MNPELEFFLENALEPVSPSSPAIGRVVIEPDYDVDFDAGHADLLRGEIIRFLQAQHPDPAALACHDGVDTAIPPGYPLLARYLRKVTFHADKMDGPWIEVAPPGNWI